MPRLGASRASDDRIGNAVSGTLTRTVTTYAQPVQPTSTRTVASDRTGETHAATIETDATGPKVFERTALTAIPGAGTRLGGAQLGENRLGGGDSGGITTSTTRAVTVARTIESYLNAFETTTARSTVSPRTVETHLLSVETDVSTNLSPVLTRTATTYIGPGGHRPGRLGDNQLGDKRLGGGDDEAAGIYTSSSISAPFWIIDGLQVRHREEETRTWQQLELVFRAEEPLVTERLRPLDQYSGKLDIIDNADGGFLTVDRQDGNNTYYLRPPDDQVPPRLGGNYLVDEYTEELVDQQGQVYRVTVRFVPESERNTTSDLAETASAGEWGFRFNTGEFATSRVHQEMQAGASASVRTQTLQLILEPEEAKVLEESASHLNAVRVREVPDGENVVEDNTAENRNTVFVDSPNEEVFESGDYRVKEWRANWMNDDFYQVTLSLLKR